MAKSKEKGVGAKFKRDFTARAENINQTDRTVELSFSSTTPVRRWFGYEILDHSQDAIDFSRLNDSAPLLFNHNADCLIGVVERAWSDGSKGRAIVRFSSTEDGDEKFQMVQEGVLVNTSVSYEYQADPIEQPDQLNNAKQFVIPRWLPLEISMVSVAADAAVGVGRSADVSESRKEEDTDKSNNATDGQVNDQTSTVARDNQPQEIQPQQTNSNSAIETKNSNPTISFSRKESEQIIMTQEEILKSERDRVQDIEAIAAQHSTKVSDMRKLVKEAVNGGLTVESFRATVLMNMTDEDKTKLNPATIQVSEKEARAYSFKNLIMSQVRNSGVEGGFEREISDELARKTGAMPQGMLIPVFDIQGGYQRAFQVQTAGTSFGNNLVETAVTGFIDLLRNALVINKIGVQSLPGLVGNVSIPKLTAGSSYGWVAESSAPTEASGSIGNISLTPHTLGAWTTFSRQLMLQSTPAIDGIIKSDMARNLAVAIDAAYFSGTGANGQPKGIDNLTSLQTYSEPSLQVSGSVKALGYLAGNNVDLNGAVFVATPTLWATLQGRPKLGVSSTYPSFLIENDKMVGYPVYQTANATSGYIYFVQPQHSILASWGAIEVLVDPYSNMTTGDIRVRTFDTVDFGFRYTGAQCRISAT